MHRVPFTLALINTSGCSKAPGAPGTPGGNAGACGNAATPQPIVSIIRKRNRIGGFYPDKIRKFRKIGVNRRPPDASTRPPAWRSERQCHRLNKIEGRLGYPLKIAHIRVYDEILVLQAFESKSGFSPYFGWFIAVVRTA
jgi:hypothetical protein